MTNRVLTSCAMALALVSGCVTINVYFPAVAAERAADRIIDDVWGPRAGNAPPRNESSENGEPRAARDWSGIALAALNFVVPAAHAAEPDIDISSPAIQKIVDAMEARHSKLKPYYDSGAIGLTREATIAVRDMAAVPLPERNRVKQLVSEENADRNALYREIAVANDHPEWESRIRTIFAQRWIERAQSGWYYQTDEGGWTRKDA